MWMASRHAAPHDRAAPFRFRPRLFPPMKLKKVIEAAHPHLTPYRVSDGKVFRLKEVDPGDTGKLQNEDKDELATARETLLGPK